MTIELYISDKNTMFWGRNNMHHNNYGPAIICSDGAKQWYINDIICRRIDPGVEFTPGLKEWYIDGIEYTHLEYLVMVQQFTPINETTVKWLYSVK